MEDIRFALDAMLGITFMEVIAKPIIVRSGKLLLKIVDRYVGVIPDWLYRRNSNAVQVEGSTSIHACYQSQDRCKMGEGTEQGQ